MFIQLLWMSWPLPIREEVDIICAYTREKEVSFVPRAVQTISPAHARSSIISSSWQEEMHVCCSEIGGFLRRMNFLAMPRASFFSFPFFERITNAWAPKLKPKEPYSRLDHYRGSCCTLFYFLVLFRARLALGMYERDAAFITRILRRRWRK